MVVQQQQQQSQVVTKPPRATKPMSEARRIRKPLMERKRRERINTSLNDLARLLTEARMVKAEAGKATKLEKADILELTVKHIKALKAPDDGAQAEEDNAEAKEDKNQKPPTSSYQEGFTRCMTVVEQSLKKAGKESLKERLLTHLNACLKTLQPPKTSPDASDASLLSGKDAEATGTPTSSTVKSEAAERANNNMKKEEASTVEASNKDEPGHCLTLVPTRLPTGGVAFVVQGGIDPSLLLPQDCSSVGQSGTKDPTHKTTADKTSSDTSTKTIVDESTTEEHTFEDTTVGEIILPTASVFSSNEESDISRPMSPCTPTLSPLSTPSLQVSMSPVSAKEELSSPSPTLVDISVSKSWDHATCPPTSTQHLSVPPVQPPCSSYSSSSTHSQVLPTSSPSTTATLQCPPSVSTQYLPTSTAVITTGYSPSSIVESSHHQYRSTTSPVPTQYMATPSHYLPPLEPAPRPSHSPTTSPPVSCYTPSSSSHSPTTSLPVNCYTPSSSSHTHTPPTPPPSVSPQGFYHYPYLLQATSSEEDMFTEEEEEEDIDMEEYREGDEEGPYDLSMRRMWRPW